MPTTSSRCSAGCPNKRGRAADIELKEQVQTWEDEGGNIPDVQTVSPNKSAPQSEWIPPDRSIVNS